MALLERVVLGAGAYLAARGGAKSFYTHAGNSSTHQAWETPAALGTTGPTPWREAEGSVPAVPALPLLFLTFYRLTEFVLAGDGVGGEFLLGATDHPGKLALLVAE